MSSLEECKAKAISVYNDLKEKADKTTEKALVVLRDPQFQTCTIVTAGGAITFGSAGGAFGLASGVVVGGAVGVVPALFTFGLSIPVSATVGGIGGLCTGTLVGAAAGGAGSFSIYKYRIEIKDGMMTVKVKVQDTVKITKEKAVMMLTTTKANLQESATDLATRAKKNSVAVADLAKSKAADAFTYATTTKIGVTSSAAVAGAVVGGTTTGALGTAVGAAVGVVPALFTFGLSIPAGAVVGLCLGTAVGGTTGAVGGGAIGYGGFTYRDSISKGLKNFGTKADQIKESFVKKMGTKRAMGA